MTDPHNPDQNQDTALSQQRIAELEQQLEERESSYRYLKSSLRRQSSIRDESLAHTESELARMRQQNEELTGANAKLSRRLLELEKGLDERTATILDLRNELKASSAELNRLKSENEAQQDLIVQLESDLELKRQLLNTLDTNTNQLAVLSQSVRRLDDQSAAADAGDGPMIDEAILFGDDQEPGLVECVDVGMPYPSRTQRRHKLVALNDDTGTEYALVKKRVTIGRSSRSDIRIRDGSISRQHARFIEREDGIVIEDAASKNGILVNDQRTRRATLRNGDILRIGKRCLFRFVEETTSR